jgi:hypothetical protein
MARFGRLVHGLRATLLLEFVLACAGSGACGSSGGNAGSASNPSPEGGITVPGGGTSDSGGSTSDSGDGPPSPGTIDAGPGQGPVSDAGPESSGPTGAAACGLPSAAFCETFDAPAGIGNRSGQLNGTLWGVSRSSGSQYNPWAQTQLNGISTACPSTAFVFAPNDIVICNGQLNESVDDNGAPQTLDMYPKQPFDFEGRTGKVVFDVSNDSQGSHAAWPEFWITDTPNPSPWTHEGSWTSYPRNGFGIRFAGCTDGSGMGATCSQGNGAQGVDSAIVVSNYVGNDSFGDSTLNPSILHTLTVIGMDSVLQSGPGQLNHYEIDVAQDQIDIYGTDAFSGTLDLTTTPLRHIAQIPNANLNFSRGFIWIDDGHYNGDKLNTQRIHTFTWDNVGFDGPILPRDLAFDALDNPETTDPSPYDTCACLPEPGQSTGYYAGADNSVTVTVPGVSGIAQASAALITLNIHDVYGPEPFTLNYSINGNATTPYAWPFPWSNLNSDKTFTIPISLADVKTGDNTLTFSTAESVGLTVFNVDLILVGAAGVVSP